MDAYKELLQTKTVREKHVEPHKGDSRKHMVWLS